MNWGHKIAIVITLFVVGMLSMVYFASQQTNEMIDDNYYQKELHYQELIDAQQNLLNLTSNNLVSQNEYDVIITLPYGAFEKLEQGNIELLKSDDKEKDVQLPLTPNGYNHRTINKTELVKGMYKARIRWTNAGIEYYKEESVFVE